MKRRIPSRRMMLAIATLSLASCRSPMADAQMAEQMRQMGDELNASRQDLGAVHDRIDSLRIVVVKQDSIIRQLANLAGVPVPP